MGGDILAFAPNHAKVVYELRVRPTRGCMPAVVPRETRFFLTKAVIVLQATVVVPL